MIDVNDLELIRKLEEQAAEAPDPEDQEPEPRKPFEENPEVLAEKPF